MIGPNGPQQCVIVYQNMVDMIEDGGNQYVVISLSGPDGLCLEHSLLLLPLL